MYRNKTIGVVVPAYNEEKLICRVIDTMPDFVDKIIIVDDQSKDDTADVVKTYQAKQPKKVILIEHEQNQGVGGAIVSGYKYAAEQLIDITVVMAGDAQMDPDDMPALLDPVVDGIADYSKGNRLFTGEAWDKIPHTRYLGNSALSLMTKMASGYWHIADSQTGYTAASLDVLRTIPLDKIWKRYGMPNDILVKLNVYNFRVEDVPIKPVYGIGEDSGIHCGKAVPRFMWLLTRLFVWRMKEKYIIRDFHPLVFFYFTGWICSTIGFIGGLYLIWHRFAIGKVELAAPLFAAFLFLTGLQCLFFAMWFDMEYNRDIGLGAHRKRRS